MEKRPSSRDIQRNPSARSNLPQMMQPVPVLQPSSVKKNQIKIQGLNSNRSKASINNLHQSTQTIWVTKWVDYSAKYGVGYQLSDNSTGVFFNDSTKIVVENNGSVFYYYERK